MSNGFFIFRVGDPTQGFPHFWGSASPLSYATALGAYLNVPNAPFLWDFFDVIT